MDEEAYTKLLNDTKTQRELMATVDIENERIWIDLKSSIDKIRLIET